MNSYVRDLIDLVFPNCCPGCGAPFVSGENHICSSCEIDLPLFDPQETINDRFAGRINIVEARALMKFYNAGIAQKLLHAIKYKGNRALGEYLGQFFMHHLDGVGAFAQVDAIIPVPLHKAKERSRGFNQSFILASGMAEVLNVEIKADTVVRIKKSKTQTRKSRAERWRNVSGIFSITNQSLAGKHVLLVDDVITTGATLEACGEAILQGGADSLSIAALAAAM